MEEKKLSPLEALKLGSNLLRGTIKESLAKDTSHFTKDEGALLKSHGTYEQDDRDLRQDLLKQGKEPAYSMMVRSKIPGGVLTPEQYIAHDDLCAKYGNNTMRITDRQGIQFHGVLKKNVKALIRTINEKLVTTLGACGDNVRNVMACPAPFHDRMKLQIARYAKVVSDQFLPRGGAYQEIWLDGEKMHLPEVLGEEPIYGKVFLPRKFKIGIAFPEDNCIDVYTHDLGIVPEIINGELKGFNILVGGGLGMTHGVATTYPRLGTHFCFVKPEDLLAISKAIVLTQRDHGNRADRKRARMKYLIDEKGIEWFRAEVESRFGKKTEPAHPIRWQSIENHLGWNQASDGKWVLGLFIENGRVKDDGAFRLKSGLRAFVEKYRPKIYLTAQQDILLAGFEENQKKEAEDFLRGYGVKMPWELSKVRQDAMACPALPTCGLAITESERALPGIIDTLENKIAELGLDKERIMVRMTGCANGCARPYNAEIAYVGRTVGTYAVYLGGSLSGNRLNVLFADKVPAAQAASSVYPALEIYKKHREPNERFGDFCVRYGIDKLKQGIQ